MGQSWQEIFGINSTHAVDQRPDRALQAQGVIALDGLFGAMDLYHHPLLLQIVLRLQADLQTLQVITG